MGDNLNAGDNYVLRVKLENLVDGSTQSDNYALMGQDIRFYIRQPNNEELYASTASVTDRGMIQEFDLYTDGEINYGSDFDGNGITNLQDFATFVWQWLHPSLIVWACLPLILARKRRFFDVGFNVLFHFH